MKENFYKRVFLLMTLLMSASLVYGGYQVHREADKKNDYKEAVRQKAVLINMSLCEGLERGSFQTGEKIKDPLSFLRVCAEELN